MTTTLISFTPCRSSILLLLVLLHGMITTASGAATAAERQVQERVRENVDYFMNAPVLATSLHSDFYDLGGFPHALQAPDRDLALQYMFSQVKTRRIKVYYGMETGVFLGYGDDFSFATNREPGESGYLVDENNSTDVNKYWNTCVNRDTGQPEECRMKEGAKYVACQNDCELVPCANQGTDDSLEKKWCRNYTIEKVQASSEARGYVPRTYHCINSKGQFTQTPGQALQSSDPTQTGDCTFRDGTLVTREIVGPFAYCGGGDKNTTCSTTYTGTYRSRDYDPRYRTWYLDAAAAQHHLWSDPYTFFSTGDIGITWADPIYSRDAMGQQIFEGILAVDYPLDTISDFLVDAYADKTDTLVAIFEDKEPHYVVGVSTGSTTTKRVLKEDPTMPCPEDTEKECEAIRLPLAELDETDDDKVFQNALEALKDAGFPDDSFVSVTVLDDRGQSAGYYSAISIIYEHPNANLKWRIVVANPIQRNPANTITLGQSQFFAPLCFTGGLGFAVCTALFVMYYRRRTARAVVFSDFRFTSAFIFGCALLNLTTFTLVGENTDELCMLRMWSFHLLFALALSPLFVKVYRLWKLTGDTATGMQRRRRISNLQAALYTVPIPAVQAVILLLVSLLDPPVETETMEWEGGSLVPNVLCSSETDAFAITQLVFDVSLVCVGCFLAFLTRNMDEKFGEPKQLLFSMYNIAFTGVILIVLFVAVDIEQDGKRMLQAIGVFWATVISSAAFVVPRLMQANLSRGGSSHHAQTQYATTRVSGLNLNTEHSAHSFSGSGCNANQTPTEEFTAESQPMEPPLTP